MRSPKFLVAFFRKTTAQHLDETSTFLKWSLAIDVRFIVCLHSQYTMSAFEELGVMPEIIQAIEDMEWLLPTPVQTETIPLILGGGDVSAAAETGSGKTGAFAIPILQTVFESRRTNLAPLKTTVTATGPIQLSSVDRGKEVYVDGNLAQCRHPSIWQGVRATRGVARGSWYFTARADDDGLLRIGWSSQHAALNLGTDSRGFGFGGTGMKSHGSKFDRYGAAYTKGDTVWAAIDFYEDGNKCGVRISYGINDENKGVAFDISAAKLGANNLCLRPHIAMKNAQVTVDFAKNVPFLDNHGFRPIGDATIEDSEPELTFATAAGKTDDTETATRTPLALILEPSRELAGQVEQELLKFGKYLEADSVRHLLLVGGGKPQQEIQRLKEGVDIVSGTLGTIKSNLSKKRLSLDSVRFFVLDEADTFATDNLRDVLSIHEAIPVCNNVQTLLFSATLHSPEIKALAEKIQRFPLWIDLKGKNAVPETVHHTLVRLDANADAALLESFPRHTNWPVDGVHKTDASDAADVRSFRLKRLKLAALKRVIDAHKMQHAMLFARTQLDCDNIESFLLQQSGVLSAHIGKYRFRSRRDTGPELEYSCACLHGGRRQEERDAALAAFKAGEIRFLICTDVAARGIDVRGLPYLVNVTLPDKSENYIHRVGRVGRAEHFGLAVSLVGAQKEAVWFHTCGKPKGGMCNRRKLVDAGGCVMWYNEPKLLTEIEERLKGRIEELDENFHRRSDKPAPVYGAKKGEIMFNELSAANVNALKPSLLKLVSLEQAVQASFLAMHNL